MNTTAKFYCTPPQINLGAVLQQARADRKLSLKGVADRAGLTKGHVWELEQGLATNPGVNTLLGLSRALDVDPLVLARAAFGMAQPPTNGRRANTILPEEERLS